LSLRELGERSSVVAFALCGQLLHGFGQRAARGGEALCAQGRVVTTDQPVSYAARSQVDAGSLGFQASVASFSPRYQ
jgi:hypothetical protein